MKRKEKHTFRVKYIFPRKSWRFRQKYEKFDTAGEAKEDLK